MSKRKAKCVHRYERRRAGWYGAFYWLCTRCGKPKPTAKDPLVAAYMSRDGMSESEATEIARAVRGVLS